MIFPFILIFNICVVAIVHPSSLFAAWIRRAGPVVVTGRKHMPIYIDIVPTFSSFEFFSAAIAIMCFLSIYNGHRFISHLLQFCAILFVNVFSFVRIGCSRCGLFYCFQQPLPPAFKLPRQNHPQAMLHFNHPKRLPDFLFSSVLCHSAFPLH